MAFPQTLNELKTAGYRFESDARCKGCGEEIEFWLTPNQKWIPMNPMATGESEAVTHWTTCTESDMFRKDQS